MAKHLELGKKGEFLAQNFLKNKGFVLLETNWRHRKAEIDIIYKDEDILVFVEVKSRTLEYNTRPELSVTAKKQAILEDGAKIYAEEIGHDWEVRFDIISVLFHNEAYQTIEHLKDAFLSGRR